MKTTCSTPVALRFLVFAIILLCDFSMFVCTCWFVPENKKKCSLDHVLTLNAVVKTENVSHRTKMMLMSIKLKTTFRSTYIVRSLSFKNSPHNIYTQAYQQANNHHNNSNTVWCLEKNPSNTFVILPQFWDLCDLV